ncbi:MAG: S8 family serine peptidase [Anaerolineae bacterium]|nr:S8 family serine peptidase [Anaerolineae bacterium]
MPRLLPKVLSLCLALATLLPLLLIAPTIGRADGPTTNWLAAVDAALALDANATQAERAERLNISLVMAGTPVVDTYIALKNTAGKIDLAAAQKARAAELAKAQESVLKALPQTKASSVRVLGQHQLLSNSISLRVNRGDIEALRQLPGVVRITPLPNAELDLANSVPHIGATRVATELGITGRGMRIAVLDTGIDYTHRNYGGPGTMAAYMAAVTDLKAVTETVTLTAPDGSTVTTKMFPTEKIPAGYDFVGDNWPNTTDQVTEPDDDPIDPAHTGFAGGHGSHTSGISAGFGVPNASFNGSIPADSTFGGTTIYHGVAPAAQIYAYKVCSSVSSSCEGNAMISGFERSADPNQDGDMSDHVDSINMSIGGPFGASETIAAANNAVRAGIAVAISAGNSANFPYITGAPSIANRVVSVANTFATNNFAQIGVVDGPASVAGRRFIMLEQSWAPNLASVGGSLSGELVYIGRGCPGDTLEGNPTGKVALIIRGTCAVSLKGEVAGNAGARAAIVYNNVAGDSPPSFAFGGGVQHIPVLTITLANGQLLRSASGVQVTLSTANALDITDYINGGSSRGPSIDGSSLKPDISAPGSNILSTGAATGDQPANMSGTSMAAPHVAGVFALVKQAHPTWSAQEVMAATVNTANPIIKELLPNVTSRVIPLSWQGAGLVDAYKAVKTTTIAWVPDYVGTVSYGFNAVTTSKTTTKQFMLANKGTTTRTYSLAFSPVQVPTGSSVTVSPTSVTLAAGETRAVDVTLTIAASGLATYQLFNQNTVNPTYLDSAEISGFVHATESGGSGDAVSVPVYAMAQRRRPSRPPLPRPPCLALAWKTPARSPDQCLAPRQLSRCVRLPGRSTPSEPVRRQVRRRPPGHSDVLHRQPPRPPVRRHVLRHADPGAPDAVELRH